jgi:glycosyltransferase involved in cell wall biosynthesis
LEQIAGKHADIRWIGYVADADLPSLYASADVFLFPSLIEGFGIPILEAMSCGVPVVCSNISSMPEVGGDCAVYCDPHDPISIADAVASTLTARRDAIAAMTSAARAHARRYTWQSSGDALVDHIRNLVARERLDVHPAAQVAGGVEQFESRDLRNANYAEAENADAG